MKRYYAFLALVMILVAGRLPAHADTVINFASTGGNGITITQTTGGQYLTFSNLQVNSGSIAGNDQSGDSAMNAPVTVSAGTGGHFLLNSVSSDGLTGYFASNSAASLKIGDAASGTLTGSLQMIEINTQSQTSRGATFSITLVLNNLSFASCTAVNCTNSTLLSNFAQLGNGSNSSNALSFTFTGIKVTSASSLLSSTGTHGTSLAGSLDSFYDTVTPEPASLALFGSCLLMAGMKLHRRVTKS
jgi:hypothetical protein